jgi:tape measure domain-containing protein
MEFNNRQFEQGVRQSTDSLAALKKGLNLDASAKSLTNLGNVANNFSLASISEGVTALSNRFSAFGIMGMTVLANLTNSAVNLGKRMFNAIAIAPIKMGWQEYETQMNAIQTTLANTASKGTTLSDVNKALDELNTYADKTIYNFSEMTRNIGTFTAAGISLETSVSAIKGIANLAAVSGSNSQQASTAMYQLSQALASGTVKLMDWNSVVNAGMGGQVFQDALKETARLHKVNIDDMIKREGSFRETLQKGWLTSEILTETLSKFTGDLTEAQLKTMGYNDEQIAGILKLGVTANDAATKVKTITQLQQTLTEAIQSGWAKSWQIILGDFNEAKEFMTSLSDLFGGLIGQYSDARNTLLQKWKDAGGRKALIAALTNSLNALFKVLGIVKEAFTEIIPPVTGFQLGVLSWKIKFFTDKLTLSEESAEKLKKTFRGVAAIFDIVIMAVSAIASGFADLIGLAAPAGGSILNFTANLGDFIVGIRDAIKANDTFNKAIDKIRTFVSNASVAIKGFLTTLQPFFDRGKNFISDTFKNTDLSGVDAFVKRFKIRFEPLTALFETVGKVFVWFGKIVERVSPFFFKLASLIGKAVGGFVDNIMDGLNDLDFNNVFDTVNGGLIAALILAVKKFVDGGSGVFGGITDILDGVKGSLEAWQQSLKAKTLLSIATAIALLAASLIALSLVNPQKLNAALMAVTVMLSQLLGAMALIEKIPGGKNSTKSIGMLTALSISLLLIARAVTILSSLDPVELTKGLIGISVILTELALFMEATSNTKIGGGKGLGLILMATSLIILASAVEKFGNIDPKVLQQGLLGVAAVLAELALFTNLTRNSKNVISTALGLIILATALLIFGSAIEKIGSLSWEQLGKGLAGMAAGLLIMAGALRLMPKNMLGMGLGLLVVSTSMVVMAQALQQMGTMSWEELGKGLGTLAASMLILALGLNAMRGTIGSAIAIAIVSGALLLLAPALKQLGSMSLKEIGLSLLTLAGVFVIIGLAGLVLAPLIPTLLALAGTMLLFGLASAAVGAGLLAFSLGLSALATAGTAGAAAIVMIITSLIGLIPAIAIRIAEAIIDFAMVIKTGVPIIGEAILVLLQTVISIIVNIVPQLAAAVVYLIVTILETIALNIPRIVQAGFDIILGLLKGIRDNIGEVVITVGEIVVEFLNALEIELPKIVQAGFDLIVAFIDGLADSVEKNTPTIFESLGKLGKAVIEGMVKGITDNATLVWIEITKIATGALDAIKKALGIKSPSTKFKEVAKYAMLGFVDGVKKYGTSVTSSVEDLANTAITSMSYVASTISNALSNEMDMNPSIRPVIDLSDVQAGSKEMNGLFANQSLNVAASSKQAFGIANGMQASPTENGQVINPNQGPTISLVQNNYSPTALSNLEIYRQTKNQLLLLKGLAVNP